MLQIFERIGRQVQALGVPRGAQFTAASALLSYILGVAGQNAADARRSTRPRTAPTSSARRRPPGPDLDPDEFPFTRSVAAQLRDHDDRAQFLAGIDLILAGIQASATS